MRGLLLRLACITALVGGLAWAIWAAPGLCGNDFMYEVASPGKIRKVVVFHRSCGATTGFSTQASILADKEELKNEAGNLFSAGEQQTSGRIEIEWLNDHSLVVSHSKVIQLSHDTSEVDGVKVVYRTF